jgi:uncharacterized protein (DUF1015 family)
MAVIKPIQGVRPVRDKAHLVVSRALYTYKKHFLQAKMEENPFTFLHVIQPEQEENATTKPYSLERFKLVGKKYNDFKKEKILVKDTKPAFYIYCQLKNKDRYIGIIGGSSVDDYNKGLIKIHEQTITKREEVFTQYLEVCGFNAEPVLLTYNDSPAIEKIIEKYAKQRAEYEFTTSDRITHLLWPVFDSSDIQKIIAAFKKVPSVYIADGHHRSSSSALLAAKVNRKGKKEGMHNYCLAFFVAKSHLHIYDFNRLVRELNGFSVKEFLKKISPYFDISSVDLKNAKPAKKHHFSFYCEGKWYLLKLKKGLIKTKDPLSNLDALILNQFILEPVLNIKDLKTDNRISFMGGQKGMPGLQALVDSGKYKAAFALYPVKGEELMHIADAGQIMPPKSTYIEPKLRSGLIIQELFE